MSSGEEFVSVFMALSLSFSCYGTSYCQQVFGIESMSPNYIWFIRVLIISLVMIVKQFTSVQ